MVYFIEKFRVFKVRMTFVHVGITLKIGFARFFKIRPYKEFFINKRV